MACDQLLKFWMRPTLTEESFLVWDGEWQITLEVFRDLGIALAPLGAGSAGSGAYLVRFHEREFFIFSRPRPNQHVVFAQLPDQMRNRFGRIGTICISNDNQVMLGASNTRF